MSGITEEVIREEILDSISILGLSRMPTTSELRDIGRGRLHTRIGKSKGYSGWSEDLGIPLKSGTTTTGNKFEKVVALKLESIGYEVERMTTKHPYDLLVNSAVKIDVKSANIYYNKGFKTHTFNLSKKNPTCDIYVLIALDENGEVEKELVVPSHFVNQRVIAIGVDSIYDKYHERYDFVQQYSDFYKSVAL